MQSYALSGFNPSILPFFNSSSCGAYTKFAAETARLAITVAKGTVNQGKTQIKFGFLLAYSYLCSKYLSYGKILQYGRAAKARDLLYH